VVCRHWTHMRPGEDHRDGSRFRDAEGAVTAGRRRGRFRIRGRSPRERSPAAVRSGPGGAIVVEGHLAVRVGERRLVLDIDGPGERDLADIVREAGAGLGMGGVVHVGPVRIEITPLEEP